jgi:hypothetical protein
MDYSLDPTRFGKCQAAAAGSDQGNPSPATSGNCIVGGTTGYSVKMISNDYLNQTSLPLGGEGTSGPLINKPDANF